MKLTTFAGSLLPFMLLAVMPPPKLPELSIQNKSTSQGKPPTLPKLPIEKKKQDEAKPQSQATTKDKQAGRQETKPGQKPGLDTQRLINPITGRPYLPDTSGQNDLIQRFARQNPLLGVWRISTVVRPGPRGVPPVGYFTFTRSHLSIHIINPNPTGTATTGFQSSLRIYRIQGNRIITTSLIGARTGKKANDLLLERRGMRESRRFEFVDPNILRLYNGLTSYFELVRIADI